MHYVEILVSGAAYHGDTALTYQSERELSVGAVVCVPLRNARVLGIVTRRVKKPSFAVKAVLDAPEDLPMLPALLLTLLAWIKTFYPSPLGVITQQFLPKQFPKKSVETLSLTAPTSDGLPPLTSEQVAVIKEVGASGTHLLHGETGSGKTRVYVELAKKSIAAGKSVLALTPEIGLTSQLAHDFENVFGKRVIILHSQLTEATRQRLWVQILKQTEPLIIVGPRSALFSPVANFGLIVIDEAHETAYKQDQAPYYHATRIASKLAELHKAPLILGSATPLINDYFFAEAKSRPILRMSETAAKTTTVKKHVSVVDLRDRSKFTKKSYLSDELIQAAKETLDKGEQALFFLNRRGTARVVFCENCGWQAVCPHCDLPLVYHGDSHRMCCHTCNYRASAPLGCPECNNVSIVFRSIGTKALVGEVARLFPDARIMRFDTDNKKAERIEQHYPAIKNGEVDILVGTQTLVKGLDLPKLGLVGVVMADTSLYFPDFSAQERTYQLLSQVLGRVGRGHRESRAVVQTYNPGSPLLASVLKQDWQTFYHQELVERRAFLFPPFCYLLKLTCRRASVASAQKNAQSLADRLIRSGIRVVVEGPAPAFHEKVQNKYQWQLVIKSKDRAELLKVIAALPNGWSYDIDPMNLL